MSGRLGLLVPATVTCVITRETSSRVPSIRQVPLSTPMSYDLFFSLRDNHHGGGRGAPKIKVMKEATRSLIKSAREKKSLRIPSVP